MSNEYALPLHSSMSGSAPKEGHQWDHIADDEQAMRCLREMEDGQQGTMEEFIHRRRFFISALQERERNRKEMAERLSKSI